MRIFLSFNSRDIAFGEAIRAGLSRLEPRAEIFFSPVSLGSGFWLPTLAEEIAQAEAFLLLIGPSGIGPWQEVEYFTAFDRHINDKRFALVPAIVAGAEAPGLSFLRSLNWVEAPVITEDKVLHRLLGALKGETVTSATPLWKLVNPYRGLEAMNEANADYFYGRSLETSAVLTALANKPGRCPILIGASGVGKSSVAQAGVLSALKAMRWPDRNAASSWPMGLRNSRGWPSLTMRPGEAPLEALVATITRLWELDAKDPDKAALPRRWSRRLSTGGNTLSDLITATQYELKKRNGEAPECILLYLDQGEELYTRAGRGEANRFAEIFAEGLRDSRLRGFASFRADYFDRLQADEPIFRYHEHVNVPPLDRTELHEVVTSPARALGVCFEDNQIASRITNAAAAEPGALPLLSYLLTDMWTGMVKRGDAILRLPAQAIEVGGVLSSHAEQFLNANPSEERALRRLLTLKLAVVPPVGEPVRRQTTREECTDAEWILAARLADHPWRLVVMTEREVDRCIVAEVTHEALLRAWPRLSHWLREEREFLVFKGDVERAERRWQDVGRADKALLSGFDLARAEEWLPARAEDLSTETNRFVQLSIAANRNAKERQLRFQRRVSIGTGIAATLMTMLTLFAWFQWVEADRERDNATKAEIRVAGEKERADGALKRTQITQSRFLAELALGQRNAGDAGTALVLALEALPDLTSEIARPYVPEAELQLDRARRDVRERLVLKDHEGGVWAAAFSADGKRIVTASDDRTSRLWDADSGKQIGEPLKTQANAVLSAAFSPDGRRIVTGSADNTARLWDAETGKQIGEPLKGHTDLVRSAAFSPDGRRIVTASSDSTARVWDAETGRQIGEPLQGHAGFVLSAAFSPDSRRIVTASADNTARVWDVETGTQIGEPLKGHEDIVRSAAFSPDGKRIVTASWDRTTRLWNSQTGSQIGEPLKGHVDAVSSAAFSADGKRIVTASADKTARLWDAETGKQIGEPLKGHADIVRNAAFSPDGKRIVTASSDNTTRIWEAETRKPIGMPLQGHADVVRSAVFSSDGKRALTASWDRTARLWDVETGKQIGEPLKGHADVVASAAFSPDGKRIVTASWDKTARMWDLETGEQIGEPLTGHAGFVLHAQFSPDGRRVVTASFDKTARLWDVETGQQVGEPLKGHTNVVRCAAFSPDGKRIITASSDNTARLWDAETGKQIGEPLQGHDGPVLNVAFSPDGSRIITASSDKTARLWDVETRKQIGEPLKGHVDALSGAVFSPDGKRIVSVSSDKTARLWDAETGKEIGEPIEGYDDLVYSVAYSPDGKRILTTSGEKAWLYELFADTKELVLHANIAAPRCLTAAQRNAFFLPPEPPSWCIELGKWPYHTPEWKQWLLDTRSGKNPPLPAGP